MWDPSNSECSVILCDSCYAKGFEDRSPEVSCGSARTQRSRRPLCKGTVPTSPLLCQPGQPGSTPVPGTSWPSCPNEFWGEPSWLEAWTGSGQQVGSDLYHNKDLRAGDTKSSSVLLGSAMTVTQTFTDNDNDTQTQAQAMTITQTFPSIPIGCHGLED